MYIGQTNNVQRRIQEHKHDKRAHKPIHNAIVKYGFENFDLSIEYYGEDYNNVEKALIKKYDSMNKEKGYNIISGGQDSSGEDNPMSKISFKQKCKIENLLIETDIPIKRISEITGVSVRTICNINIGAAWKNDSLTYPIRRYKLSKKAVDSIIADLMNEKIPLDEIAEKYSIQRYTVLSINKGTSHHRDNLKYPIRNIFLSQDKIIEIITLLSDSDYTEKDIADILNVKRSTVYRINTGTSYRQENIEYPIRKNRVAMPNEHS